MRLEAIIKFLKNYKKEMESAEQVYIIEQIYFEEDTETVRRQIIIDYPLRKEKAKAESKSNSILYL